MAIATGTALLIGAGVAAGASIYSANKQAEAAEEASDQAAAARAESQAFAEEQQAEWEAVFGPIQDNLSEYYKNIDPNIIAAQGLEQFEVERTEALKRANENLAQRGLATSGAQAALETSSELNRASERARIRAEAPMKAAQEQMEFLSLGLGSDPSRTTQSVYSQGASQAQQLANQQQAQADEASDAATTAVVEGTGALLDYYTETPEVPDNTSSDFSYNYSSL